MKILHCRKFVFFFYSSFKFGYLPNSIKNYILKFCGTVKYITLKGGYLYKLNRGVFRILILPVLSVNRIFPLRMLTLADSNKMSKNSSW